MESVILLATWSVIAWSTANCDGEGLWYSVELLISLFGVSWPTAGLPWWLLLPLPLLMLVMLPLPVLLLLVLMLMLLFTE